MAAVVPEGSPVETPAVQEYRRQWLALPTWLLRVARSLAVALRLRYGSPGFRFLMLAFTVFIVFSGYFSYDLPGITSEDLKKEPVSLTNVELGLLFSVYAFPNAFLPLFSGMFFTVLGVWKGVLIIGVVIGCGIAIIAAGVAAQSFWLMLLGRAVYGLGGESLMVGVDVLVTNWFKDKEIGLAYGLLQAAGQAGSFAAFYGIPMLLKEGHYGYVTAYYVGLLFAVVAVACLFMGHALEQVSIAPSVAVLGDELSASDAGLPPEQAGAVQQLEKALSHEHAAADLSSPDAKHAASRTGGGGGALHRKKRWFSCSLTSPLAVAVGLNHLVGLQVDFWLVIVGIAAYSGSFYTFMAFGMDYLESKYGLDMEDSGRIIGIISIASCGLSPLSGFLLDKRGGRPYAAFVGMAGSCAAFALLGFTNAPVMPTVVFAGVCYSVLPAALYPLVADVVPEEAFTQVYAIANAAVNVVLTFTMLLAGELSAAAKPHSSAEGAVELLVSAAATAAAPARRRLMIAAAAGDAAAAEGGEDPKLDYFYVFVLFVVYTGVGTVAMGWLSLSHFQAWRRRSTSQALTRQRPLRGDAAVAVSTSVIVAGGNVGALGSDDEGGAAGGALRRAGARDRAVGGNSALTPPPASSGSGSNSAGAGESVYQAVESAGFGIPGMRMGVVRRGLLRVLGFIVE